MPGSNDHLEQRMASLEQQINVLNNWRNELTGIFGGFRVHIENFAKDAGEFRAAVDRWTQAMMGSGQTRGIMSRMDALEVAVTALGKSDSNLELSLRSFSQDLDKRLEHIEDRMEVFAAWRSSFLGGKAALIAAAGMVLSLLGIIIAVVRKG
jgi:hypothetical protein